MVSEKNNCYFNSISVHLSTIQTIFLGYAEKDRQNSTLEEQTNDVKRVKFMEDHLNALLSAIRYEYYMNKNKTEI